jgi:uncharacterized protein (DUF2141 family)
LSQLHRSAAALRPLAAALFVLLLSGNGATTELDLRVENLRNDRGTVRICVTGDQAYFPACQRDPAKVSITVPAANASADLTLAGPGNYAVAVFHDENGNGKLDKVLGIPREGFGFSRNPAIRLGPPRYAEARMTLEPGRTSRTVRLRYLL